MAVPRKEDEFERREMHDESPVVHRDKRVSRFMAAMLGIPGLLTIVLGAVVAATNDTASRPVPGAALPFVVAGVTLLGLMLMLLGLVLAVVRTVVTEREVHVKYGLWGPRVALASIRACNVVDYDWTEFGGFGIRLGKGGTWAYVPSGGRVLELRYEDSGKEKRVLVGVDDPDETARQINRARGARIEVESAEPATAAADEALALAEEEAATEEASDARLER